MLLGSALSRWVAQSWAVGSIGGCKSFLGVLRSLRYADGLCRLQFPSWAEFCSASCLFPIVSAATFAKLQEQRRIS